MLKQVPRDHNHWFWGHVLPFALVMSVATCVPRETVKQGVGVAADGCEFLADPKHAPICDLSERAIDFLIDSLMKKGVGASMASLPTTLAGKRKLLAELLDQQAQK